MIAAAGCRTAFAVVAVLPLAAALLPADPDQGSAGDITDAFSGAGLPRLGP